MIAKVLVYLTRTGGRASHDLLVFAHPFHPEAGIQVPGGTIERGESPEQAALRELHEEAGLAQVRLAGELGTDDVSMAPFGRDEVQRRHIFHAILLAPAPERWRHFERSAHGADGPIALDFFWRPVADPPILSAGQGNLLPILTQRLKESGS